MKKIKGLLKSLLVMGMVALLTASPKIVSANSVGNYNELNKIIMDETVRRGKKDLNYYDWLKEEISSLSNKEERRILELKLDAILLRYENTIKSNDSSSVDKTNDNSSTNDNSITNDNSSTNKSHRQLLFGDGSGRLNLNKGITREEAATIIYRAEPNLKIKKNNNYSDVKNRWSLKYIENINSNGYNNKFRPTDGITRAEALSLIEQNFALKKSNNKISFRDIKGHWAEGVIKDYSGTIVQGSGNGRFRPNDYVSRAEFIVMINRASRNCTIDKNRELEQRYKKDLDMVPWAKGYILEALFDH